MTPRVDRRAFLAAGSAIALAGCLGDTEGTPTEASAGDSANPRRTGTEVTAATPTAEAGTGPPLAEFTLSLPGAGEDLRRQAQSGGPPKDGIPAIDEPRFTDAAAADDRLDGGDIVFGLSRGGVAKAYPQHVLVWHEIVNDVIDGDPVSVTYCPLTGTVQGFDRGETTFGVSGRLLNNNLIMYDRGTENWWPQVLATAIPGPWNDSYAGRTLSEFRVVWTTWERWRERHPATSVLSTETGYARNYQRDPYGQYNPAGGYYTSDSTLFPRLNDDDRFPAKHVVLGVRTPAGAAAVPKAAVREAGIVEGAIGETSVLWVYDDALDTAYAYHNPDRLDFAYRGGSVSGPDDAHNPVALPLDRLVTFDAMWFAWSGFYPETTVHG